jgi:p-methyltransferase
MEHTKVHDQREKYGLTGTGGKWSHNTMNHEDAARIKLDLFQSITNSTHIDPDTSLWYMAYLYDQGHSFKDIEHLQAGINDLMKRQLATSATAASSWPGLRPQAAALNAAE